MKLYRATKNKFIKDLSGEGARLFGGRWNKPGDAMLYFSEHLSLCILEILVHMDFKYLDSDYSFLEVSVPDDAVTIFNPERSIKTWNAVPFTANTQVHGSKWLTSESSLGLSVPSAVLKQERNILINPNHTLFSELKIVTSSSLKFDSRFLRKI
ncbi:RES family NAD+ phosphorylase [Ulvibacter antarcticus]|uniref:RES domain-containing protein n=1 Tax=Ulvibacter antarcticus TaxID=442714 RepID=A0A3L9YEJ7_9FLAO|nr:RES family NAD+ phosphorylase [Ulvibacter antarcticus]RMA57887.1 RES domain-containing protein [Ulvibacter antarcticus]